VDLIDFCLVNIRGLFSGFRKIVLIALFRFNVQGGKFQKSADLLTGKFVNTCQGSALALCSLLLTYDQEAGRPLVWPSGASSGRSTPPKHTKVILLFTMVLYNLKIDVKTDSE